MKNIFDVQIFPSKMNTSQAIHQKLERNRILGGFHPSRVKSTGRIVVDFQYVHQGAIPNNFMKKKKNLHQLCPEGILICLDYICFNLVMFLLLLQKSFFSDMQLKK